MESEIDSNITMEWPWLRLFGLMFPLPEWRQQRSFTVACAVQPAETIVETWWAGSVLFAVLTTSETRHLQSAGSVLYIMQTSRCNRHCCLNVCWLQLQCIFTATNLLIMHAELLVHMFTALNLLRVIANLARVNILTMCCLSMHTLAGATRHLHARARCSSSQGLSELLFSSITSLTCLLLFSFHNIIYSSLQCHKQDWQYKHYAHTPHRIML